MKYALFEFVTEKACEIGETRWIIREDPQTFENIGWDAEKEVMVAWPTEFTKVSKKIIKGSIDPSTVETTTCVARVLKFSDDYECIRQQMKRYVETGLTTTPNHGRGQRQSKKNGKYLQSDEDVEQQRTPKKQKRQHCSSSEMLGNAAMDVLKAKYNLTQKKVPSMTQHQVDETDDECNSSSSEEEEVAALKKEKFKLQQLLQQKDKEITRLHCIINNLKEIPALSEIANDLRKQVEILRSGKNSSSCISTTKYSEVASSQSPSSSVSSRSPSSNASADSDVESDLVTFGPNVTITKAQLKVIRSKMDLKDYVYSIMGILWSREVLCTHSMTGKVSNAFKEKDAKPQLDKDKVQSICAPDNDKDITTTVETRADDTDVETDEELQSNKRTEEKSTTSSNIGSCLFQDEEDAAPVMKRRRKQPARKPARTPSKPVLPEVKTSVKRTTSNASSTSTNSDESKQSSGRTRRSRRNKASSTFPDDVEDLFGDMA